MNLFGEDEVVETEASESIGALADFEPEQFFTHPRSMHALIGHEETQNQLLSLFNSGRMHHGIILNGVKGIGKATLAYRFARFLIKNPPADPNQNSLFGDNADAAEPTTLEVDREDPVFRRVASGGHADLLTLERAYDATKNKTAESLSVADLRKVEPFLRMTSSDGGWRVVVIDDADTMNRNAQNALLKILEEPPKNTVIILVTHRLGALIPTIRSRTRLFNLKPLSPDEMTELLSAKGHTLDSNQSAIINAMAEGSFGKANDILEPEGMLSNEQIKQ